jgi:adenine-specific DNA-methyltransferase
MSVVFIGGSRRLSRLNAVIRGRLDNVIERRHKVLIGDANGGDRAVQAYLAEHGYRSVTVYCTDAACRNNLGQWPVRSVVAGGQRGFDYYALKDAAMAADAECGLMLWDGKSRGTLANIRRLLAAGKPVAVYLAGDHGWHTIRSEPDLAELEAPPPGVARRNQTGGEPAGQGVLFPGLQKRRRAAEP